MVSLEPGRLRSTSAASSASTCAEHGITGNLPPAPRCLHRRTGFRRPFTTRARGWNGQTQTNPWRACGSPRMTTWTGRRSSSSATRTSPRAQPCDRSVPGAPARRSASSSRWTWRQPPDEVEPRPPRRPSSPGDTGHPRPGKPYGLLRRLCQMPAEVSRARGRPALTARRPLAASRKQAAELCPDPIRSDTSRRETAAMPEGEPDTERRSAEADRRTSCDPASQAGLVHKNTRR